MQEDIEKCSEDNITEMDEDKFFSEYIFTKYTLMVIPVYLSFLLFTFLDGSYLGLIKIMAGYTAVFSLFILMDEPTYQLIKKNINLLFKYFSLAILLTFISLAIFHFSDSFLISSAKNSIIDLSILIRPIIHFMNKFLFSSFLLMVTFYINICLLAFLIKLDIFNRLVSHYSEKQ